VTAAVLVRTPPPRKPPPKKKRRRRFRFSLNGLAIQLSAFALSFTLVALLVVSGSQAAFVEPSEILETYVPIGTAAPTEDGPRRPAGARPVADSPTPTPTESPAPTTEAPEPTPTPEPTPELELPDAEVTLTDSAAGTALFADERLIPGLAAERCIAVTFTGNVDVEAVRLYAAATSGALAPYLDLTITMGAPATGPSSSCTGFAPSGTVYSGTLAGFAATHSSFATGRATWDPSGREETRGFRFSVSVRDDPSAAGKTATFGFSWRTEAS
jgi:hypothetical protein